jgi:hypothetical protein
MVRRIYFRRLAIDLSCPMHTVPVLLFRWSLSCRYKTLRMHVNMQSFNEIVVNFTFVL